LSGSQTDATDEKNEIFAEEHSAFKLSQLTVLGNFFVADTYLQLSGQSSNARSAQVTSSTYRTSQNFSGKIFFPAMAQKSALRAGLSLNTANIALKYAFTSQPLALWPLWKAPCIMWSPQEPMFSIDSQSVTVSHSPRYPVLQFNNRCSLTSKLSTRHFTPL